MMARLRNGVPAAIERSFAMVPRALPTAAERAGIRIVSHRGECDNRRIRENTFAAFDPPLDNGVWGIEFDLRWTRDLEPVICHDADLWRVFGHRLNLSEIPFHTLRARTPDVPHLDEILQRYGARCHLMLELKAEPYPDPGRQQARLQDCLQPLRPATDFHVLSLDTALFDHADFLPPNAHLPVARLNVADMSEYALRHGCAGLAGPYFAVGRRRIARHQAAGQGVGVGFPSHRNTLYRELGRGVRWVFADHAVRLQRLLDRAG